MQFYMEAFRQSVQVVLFDDTSSGTIGIRAFGYKFELDVKHASDFKNMKFNVVRNRYKDGHKKGRSYWTAWIPVKWKCQGFRITIFPTTVKVEGVSVVDG